jgi:hypothetical protein
MVPCCLIDWPTPETMLNQDLAAKLAQSIALER